MTGRNYEKDDEGDETKDRKRKVIKIKQKWVNYKYEKGWQ
jgi:hypothetical protein